ncbi:hypothetical protein SK128_016742 [Halocaridina rubra]|uniref:C2H2-type domain-containing protein n=1 Tax=Halocaridina rubra TaxID=373956 RepID=A0AAN8WUS0_HALRR
MKKIVFDLDGPPPPLVIAKSQTFLPFVPNVVNPLTIIPHRQGSDPAVKVPNTQLVQTADGKKILLAIVSPVKASANNQPLLLTKSVHPLSSNNAEYNGNLFPVMTPGNNFQTMGENSPKFIVPTVNQPVQEKRIPHSSALVANSDANCSNDLFRKNISIPLISNPVISTSKAGTYINNGQARFKIVGKPVAVTLGRVLPETTSNTNESQSSESLISQLDEPTNIIKSELPYVENLPTMSCTKPEDSTEPSTGLSSPPAYLNIQIKEEPKEEIDTNIKIEPDGPSSVLDVRIKEEENNDQKTLLANDEQLRDIIDVATQEMKANPMPRFYIRTAQGKLVSISSSEAKDLGLSHSKNVEENQRKLMAALNFLNKPGSTVGKAAENVLKTLGEDRVKTIPGNVNVQDFVNRNISEEAKKTAEYMKSLSEAARDRIIREKFDPAIIEEVKINDQRYLRIQIKLNEADPEICDIPITSLNTYVCPFCRKNFKVKSHIVSHIRMHTGERPYPCDICGKKYRQRIDIIRHMRIHTGEKPFTCGVCNASFNQKSNLRSHIRIHTGERPVQCKVCGKGFSRNTHLKQHLKLHTGEKPYKCKVCNRPFRFKSGLQAHERIHSGLKPYACSTCGRSFTQIVGLIRHERTHAGEKPFRCHDCGKSFDSRQTLQSHCKKHTDIRPYHCKLCSKTFTDQPSLHCHTKKYHKNTLICIICHKESFRDRVELREHLREHERMNWQETPDGDLVPSALHNRNHCVSVNDIPEENENSESLKGNVEGNLDKHDLDFNNLSCNETFQEQIHVEVELDPDDPLEEDDEDGSEYEENELHIEGDDPLA